MLKRTVAATLSLLVVAVIATDAAAQRARLESGATARIVDYRVDQGLMKVGFFVPSEPTAGLVLFQGGATDIPLERRGLNFDNFIIRVPTHLANRDIMVAIVDLPSRLVFNGQGPRSSVVPQQARRSYPYFSGDEILGNIVRVIDDMKEIADVPVWVAGLSYGAHPAAYVAIRSTGEIDGLVLLSPAAGTQFGNSMGTLLSQADVKHFTQIGLGAVTIPTAVITHARETCPIVAGVDLWLPRQLSNAPVVESVQLSGGTSPGTNPCGGNNFHTFNDIEGDLADAIAGFMNAN